MGNKHVHKLEGAMDLQTCQAMQTWWTTVQASSSTEARDDLSVVNPPTGCFLVAPVCDNREGTIEQAVKSLHGPNEDLSKMTIRSDKANELNAGESVGFSDPITPHRPNSNKAERGILIHRSAASAFLAVRSGTGF